MTDTTMLSEEVAMDASNATPDQAVAGDSRAAPGPAAAATPPPAAQPVAGSSAGGGFYAGEHQPFDPRRKSPRMAAVLSVVPGLGQIYIGYYVRGFVVASSVLMLLFLTDNRDPLGSVAGFGAFFTWLFNVIDAGRMAALYNHALAGSRAIELPSDFRMPTMGGSVVGGGALVLFGLIALSNTAFGWSLEWLERWWPIFPLALGAYLLGRGLMELGDGPVRDSGAAAPITD